MSFPLNSWILFACHYFQVAEYGSYSTGHNFYGESVWHLSCCYSHNGTEYVSWSRLWLLSDSTVEPGFNIFYFKNSDLLTITLLSKVCINFEFHFFRFEDANEKLSSYSHSTSLHSMQRHFLEFSLRKDHCNHFNWGL